MFWGTSRKSCTAQNSRSAKCAKCAFEGVFHVPCWHFLFLFEERLTSFGDPFMVAMGSLQSGNEVWRFVFLSAGLCEASDTSKVGCLRLISGKVTDWKYPNSWVKVVKWRKVATFLCVYKKPELCWMRPKSFARGQQQDDPSHKRQHLDRLRWWPVVQRCHFLLWHMVRMPAIVLACWLDVYTNKLLYTVHGF